MVKGSKLVIATSSQHGHFACESLGFDDFVDASSGSLSGIYSSETARIEFLSWFSSALLFTSFEELHKTAASLKLKPLFWQKPFPETRIPIHQYHLSLMGADALIFDIQVSAQMLREACEMLPGQNYAAIHPGSGSLKKNWPLDRFASLSEELKKQGLETVWIKGEADCWDEITVKGKVVYNLPISLLSAVISRCTVFIGNDSGPAHLSAALGIPTVAIFGPSDPQVWSPAGRAVAIVAGHSACTPCHLRTEPVNCGKECLEKISVEAVLASVSNLIS